MGLIITAIIFIASVTALVFTRVGVLQSGKIFFKVVSSMLFIALWVVSSIHIKLTGFDYLILISLIFYMLGDILLALFRTKKGFVSGMAAFTIGNIILIINLICKLGVGVWDLPVILVLLMIAAIGLKIGRLDFEGVGIIIAIYIVILCVMVAKAISLNWSGTDFTIPTALFATGAILYGVSDLVLANNKFKYKDIRWLSPLNLGLYYSGIGLIAVFSTMVF